MFGLAVTFLIVALIAGILGFGLIAGIAVEFAKIVFFVALVLFLISLIFGGVRGGFGRPDAVSMGRTAGRVLRARSSIAVLLAAR